MLYDKHKNLKAIWPHCLFHSSFSLCRSILAWSQGNFQNLAVPWQVHSCCCLQFLPTNFAHTTSSSSWCWESHRAGGVCLEGRSPYSGQVQSPCGGQQHHLTCSPAHLAPLPICSSSSFSIWLSMFKKLASFPFCPLLINTSFDSSWIKRSSQLPWGYLSQMWAGREDLRGQRQRQRWWGCLPSLGFHLPAPSLCSGRVGVHRTQVKSRYFYPPTLFLNVASVLIIFEYSNGNDFFPFVLMSLHFPAFVGWEWTWYSWWAEASLFIHTVRGPLPLPTSRGVLSHQWLCGLPLLCWQGQG